MRPGETVLVQATSGSMGTAVIQVAELAGARVIAVTSSAEKIEKCRALGANDCIDRTQVDFSAEALRLTGGRGVDLVVESVGQPTWAGSLAALRKGGRLVTYGNTGGAVVETSFPTIFWNQLTILGSSMASRAKFAEVMLLIFARQLRPVIDRVYPLAEASNAHARLDAGEQYGKVILSVPE